MTKTGATPSLILLNILLLGAIVSTTAQQPTPTSPPAPAPITNEEIIKIETALIQTGVSVTNKNGEFVENLKKEDFEVKVDKKPVPIGYFSQTVAGAVDSTIENGGQTNSAGPATVEQGRVLMFLVDDEHLSFESHSRVRKLILKFIDTEMLNDDIVAIVTSSNKLGFLQQFTSNKDVLRAAAERIVGNRNTSGADKTYPEISEYEALALNRGDIDMLKYFVGLLLARYPDMDPRTAATDIAARARAVASYTEVITKNTVGALEETIKNAGAFSGRKALYFLSDGFLTESVSTDLNYRLQRITDAAVRSNTVIYSFDVKGLDASPEDGSTAGVGAPNGMSQRLQAGSRFEMQDGPNYVAENTGGKFIHNTNDMLTGFRKVTREAYTYYLLAWEPEDVSTEVQKLRKIEISIKGHPEYKVRTSSGYLAGKEPPAKTTAKKSKKEQPKKEKKELTEEQKLIALTSTMSTNRAIPLKLGADFIDQPNDGPTFSANLQINSDALTFVDEGSEKSASLEMVVLIYDDQGKLASAVKNPLKISVPAARYVPNGKPPFTYDYKTPLKPGLYQMRIAVKDTRSGQTGVTNQWLQIPDLASKKLALSSLILGEKQIIGDGKNVAVSAGGDQTRLGIDNRIKNSSALVYLGFIYNSPGTDVTIATQILNHDKVVWDGEGKLLRTSDPARLSYNGEIALSTLSPGQYELKTTVKSRTGGDPAVRSVPFQIK